MKDARETVGIRSLLNGQTAQLVWAELERYFASGVLIEVSPGTSLLDVAEAFVADDGGQVKAWMASGTIAKPDADKARQWHAANTRFWAVVSAPWVLIQVSE